MADDLDLDLTEKMQPKKGRRAKASSPAAKDTSDFQSATDIPIHDVPARPSRRQMGWDKTTVSEEQYDARLTQAAPDNSVHSSDDEVQNIPDIEEIHEDDIAQEVAAPPSLFTSNIASYRDLDVELMNRSAFRTLDGDIDLKALVKNLCSEQEVRAEADVSWDWERLFSEVSSGLKSTSDTTDQDQERAV